MLLIFHFINKNSCKWRKSKSKREKANIFFCEKEERDIEIREWISFEIGEIRVQNRKSKREKKRKKKQNFPGKGNPKYALHDPWVDVFGVEIWPFPFTSLFLLFPSFSVTFFQSLFVFVKKKFLVFRLLNSFKSCCSKSSFFEPFPQQSASNSILGRFQFLQKLHNAIHFVALFVSKVGLHGVANFNNVMCIKWVCVCGDTDLETLWRF